MMQIIVNATGLAFVASLSGTSGWLYRRQGVQVAEVGGVQEALI